MPIIPPRSTILPENYRFLQNYIREGSGIVLDDNKHYLLESRLMPVVVQEKLASLDDLCTALRRRGNVTLHSKVVEAITTHETFFFRDAAVFEGLRALIPDLIVRARPTRKMAFWSAAASSGQEAYSLAMLFLEMGLGPPDTYILATDLSEQILARARSGRYFHIEVNRGLPAQYLLKYFERRQTDWFVKDAVRGMVTFEPFDLRSPMLRKGPFDVILCRNVLIYFDTETKKRILQQLRSALIPGGYLVLGGAETTLNLDERFTRVSVGSANFYRAPL
jgi:chemotaxis protein methyltransferase CheR